VGVALLATTLRWILVSHVLGWSLRDVSRPFFSVAPSAAGATFAGIVVMRLFPDRPAAQLVLAGSVTVVMYAVLLRMLAGGIVSDALRILPVPNKYVTWARSLLHLRVADH
jgi:hypothetical protein